MSVRVMLWAHKLRLPVSHACMRVLMVLAEHANEDGTKSYPSLDTIAREAQTDRKTVVRSLDKLEADGIVARTVGGGRTRSTEYLIRLDVEQSLKTLASGQGNPSTNSGVDTHDTPINSGVTQQIDKLNSGAEPIISGVEPPKSVLNLSKTSPEKSSLRSPRAREDDGARLSNGWQPSAEDVAFASGLGLNVDDAADEFRDYWRGVPGAKGLKADWSATWRNSCRHVSTRLRPQTHAGPVQLRRPAQNGAIESLLQARERSTPRPGYDVPMLPLLEGSDHA